MFGRNFDMDYGYGHGLGYEAGRDYGNFRRGMGMRFGNFGRGFGRGLRRGIVGSNLTGLDYDILSILYEGERDSNTLFKEISAVRANDNFPVLGCINLHLKDLSEKGYVESEDRDGKRIYHLTDKGKQFIGGDCDV